MLPIYPIGLILTGFLGSVSWYWALTSLLFSLPLWALLEVSSSVILLLFGLGWMMGAYSESRIIYKNMLNPNKKGA
jgi:hypothetical protein